MASVARKHSLMSVDEVLFEKEGVFLHTSVTTGKPDEDVLIGGTLKILNEVDGRHVRWEPDDELPATQPKRKVDQEWAVVDAVSYRNGDNNENGVNDVSLTPLTTTNGLEEITPTVKQHRYKINFNLEDLKSIKKSNRSFGWPYLIFIMKDGTTFPALHFHNGGSNTMMQKLKSFLYIKQSATDSRLFIVREHDPNALHKSFDELHIFDNTGPALVSKFVRDPYNTTLGGFSKVTNFLRDNLMQDAAHFETREDFTELLKTTELPALHMNDQEEPGYELITHAVELPLRRNVMRDAALSTAQWTRHMDRDGRVVNVPQLKDIIFKGGIADTSIRIDVWKFLLGYYSWDSSYKERIDVRKKKVDDYFRMKLQWKSITPEQANRFSLFRERESLIEKDVNRTDRTHEFYQGPNNPNLSLLNDILMTYSMYNFDLGYVQGMSDLLSPILVVMENEVDSFWCFCGFMELVHNNFEMDQEGMKKQLAQLHTLVQFLDTDICNHLESHESSNMFFCFRWLLIMFKREFIFADIMRLWEVLWTGKPCQNFHLLICVAILDTEKPVLLENNFGFNEILKHINDLCFQIDLDIALRKAEAMYQQLAECQNLPRTVCEIIGLPYRPSSVIDQEPSPLAETPDHDLHVEENENKNSVMEPLDLDKTVIVLRDLDKTVSAPCDLENTPIAPKRRNKVKSMDLEGLPVVGATSKNPIG